MNGTAIATNHGARQAALALALALGVTACSASEQESVPAPANHPPELSIASEDLVIGQGHNTTTAAFQDLTGLGY